MKYFHHIFLPFIFLLVLRKTLSCTTIYDCFPKDNNGFTIISEEKRGDGIVVYVSSSQGNDTNTGLSEDSPLRTAAAGTGMIRNGYPDTLLFKRGDLWYESLGSFGRNGVGGRSAKEPILISSYGDKALNRPTFHISTTFMSNGRSDTMHMIIKELKVTAEDSAGAGGASFLGPAKDLLFEDMFFFETTNLVFQVFNPDEVEGIFLEDIYIHKSIVYGNYPRGTGHVQGIYSHGVVNFYILDNLIYHNGWTQNPKYWADNGYGNATMFNHNTYLNWDSNLVIKGNLYLRGASMNMKFRNDYASTPTKGLLIEDNFIYGGELGIGLGGNTDEPDRFIDNVIKNNVFTETGETLPGTKLSYTHRSLSWMLGLANNVNTDVLHNLFIKNNHSSNGYAIEVSGTAENIRIENNIVDGLIATYYVVFRVSECSGTNYFSRNTLQQTNIINDDRSWVLPTLLTFPDDKEEIKGVTFNENKYFSIREYEDWFSFDNKDEFIQKTKSSLEKTEFPDDKRSIETYAQSIGIGNTVEDFVLAAAKQSKYNWDNRITASSLNNYLREGYGMDINSSLYSDELRIITIVITSILIPLAIFVLVISVFLILFCSFFLFGKFKIQSQINDQKTKK